MIEVLLKKMTNLPPSIRTGFLDSQPNGEQLVETRFLLLVFRNTQLPIVA